MADALGPWQDDPALDGCSRACAVLSRQLLAEGLIGSGRLDRAAAVLGQLRAAAARARFLAPALAWLEGWLAEQRGDLSQALQIYARSEQAAGRAARCTPRGAAGAGRLLRRTSSRKDAVEQLRRASNVCAALRAAPFIARTEEELAACRLPAARRPSSPS